MIVKVVKEIDGLKEKKMSEKGTVKKNEGI